MPTITDIIKPELPNIQALLSLTANKDTDVITLAQQELNYLEQQAVLKPELIQCEPISVILAVKSVLRKNLTLDPNAGLVYIKTRNVQVGNAWKKVLEIEPTANGLLSENRQLGLILDFTNPKIKKDEKGKVVGVEMQILIPRKNMEPRWEIYEFDESDFNRWRLASHKERARSYKNDSGKPVPDNTTMNYANALYTSWKSGPDPEFIRAKCIRHSLKKRGTNPNEIVSITLQDKIVSVIDPKIAVEESGDNETDFTQHEEVNSTINNTTANEDLPNADEL